MIKRRLYLAQAPGKQNVCLSCVRSVIQKPHAVHRHCNKRLSSHTVPHSLLYGFPWLSFCFDSFWTVTPFSFCLWISSLKRCKLRFYCGLLEVQISTTYPNRDSLEVVKYQSWILLKDMHVYFDELGLNGGKCMCEFSGWCEVLHLHSHLHRDGERRSNRSVVTFGEPNGIWWQLLQANNGCILISLG